MSEGDASTGLLDDELAKRVAGLTYRAEKVVTGLLAGMHRSPNRGASVVFVEHREYRPGDDPRLLDWRAFARTDRHSIKRFEQETQLRATLILDRSGSMAYEDKHAHASTLLAALAYVFARQGDAVGLGEFSADYTPKLPPRTRATHLERLLRELAKPPSPQTPTKLHDALSRAAERCGRRGVIVVASDLLDLDENALEPLGELTARGNDVIVFQVLHRDELSLPAWGAARFEGCEGEASVEADTSEVRDEYQREVDAFIERCRRGCAAVGARYQLCPTDAPPVQALASALGQGARRR